MNNKRNLNIEQCNTTEKWTSSKLKTSYFLNGCQLSKSQWHKAIKLKKQIKLN